MKKKVLIILSIVLILLLIIVVVIRNKPTTNEETSDNTPNYAVNEVIDEDNEKESEEQIVSDNNVISDNSTENWTPSKNTYNVVDDVNANENLTFDTISIDGKIVSFPNTYMQLKKQFGPFYIDFYGKTYELDETNFIVTDTIQVQSLPTTGEGVINFSFMTTDENGSNIKDCICNKISLSGNISDNSRLMTIALKDNIKFGSTPDEIFNAYGKVTNKYINDDKGTFTMIYKPDGTKNTYQFFGNNFGLSQVILEFNGDKTNAEIITKEE